MAQLSSYQQGQLDRAKKVLQASVNESDAGTYAKHLGALEVWLGDVINLVEQLADPSHV